MTTPIITPPPLKPGDKVAILSPATVVKPEFIDGAASWIESKGWLPVVMPHAKGPASGSFASDRGKRISDLTSAFIDNDIRAILCARGGYGCVHLINEFPESLLRLNAKWLIGFSDVSAIHAMLLKAGIKSIHGPMAKHLTLNPEDKAADYLYSILCGNYNFSITSTTTEFSNPGEARGILVGGNLAVIDALTGTSFDIYNISHKQPAILFIEDIAEPIYKIDRILWKLYLSGVMNRISALIVGQFTEYNPDKNFPSIEALIHTRLKEWNLHDLPVAMGWPVGHVDKNYPIIQGSEISLKIDSTISELKFL